MTISAGTTTEIDATVNELSVQSARISDIQMLVIYQDSVNNLGARVCDIDTSVKSITANAQSTMNGSVAGMGEIMLARMSATKFMYTIRPGKQAQVLNVSGTTTTGATIKTLTDTPLANRSYLLPLTATETLWVYNPFGDVRARILSIDGSDNITENSFLEIAAATGSIRAFAAITYTPTVAAIFWEDPDDSFFLKGQVFTISGTSLALSGGVQTLYNANGGWNTGAAAAGLSSTEAAVIHNIDISSAEQNAAHIISLSGSTLTAGSTLQIVLTEIEEPSGNGVFTNETTVLFPGSSPTADLRTIQLIKDGTTLSHTASDFADVAVGGSNTKDSIVKIADDFALMCNLGSVEATVLGSDAVVKNYSWVLGGGQP